VDWGTSLFEVGPIGGAVEDEVGAEVDEHGVDFRPRGPARDAQGVGRKRALGSCSAASTLV
jgi:hypothetical protein